MTDDAGFRGLFWRAMGVEPYDYQRRLAEGSWPTQLAVQTGCGKTAACMVAWLHRLDAGGHRRLVYALPQRTLTRQVATVARKILERLELTGDISVHVFLGGETRDDDGWRLDPDRPAILIGTIDMLISRALLRGYGASRPSWPIDFALLNNDTLWVCDEVQLFGPALPTTRQLAGLRRETALGTALPSSTLWMSATLPTETQFCTVDNPDPGPALELGEADLTGALAARLNAEKTVREVRVEEKAHAQSIARALVAHHAPGTRTLAVVNTVQRATDISGSLRKLVPEDRVVLLHSRFRPGDRDDHVDRALAEPNPDGPGVFVVSTQVLEAGVDLSARVLLTEAAPWPSLVQRAGRCNRDGSRDDALLLWVAVPPKWSAPYEAGDVAATIAELRSLEGEQVTPRTLGARAVPTHEPVHQVLRRRDLLALYDTTPDLNGNDIDVSVFIREADDLDVSVAWRPEQYAGASRWADHPPPVKEECCPVPVADLRALLKADPSRHAFTYDQVDDLWRPARWQDLRPGLTVILDAAQGGYRRDTGWSPKSREMVALPGVSPPAGHGHEADTTPGMARLAGDEAAMAPAEEAKDSDPGTTFPRAWQSLHDHLADTEREARGLLDRLAHHGSHRLSLQEGEHEAAALAARYHDLGKAFDPWQDALLRLVPDEGEREAREAAGPWAKSGIGGRLRFPDRPHLRHEFVSALALLHPECPLLDGVAERDLVAYLVAAHHGRARMTIRNPPAGKIGETDLGVNEMILGVKEGDAVPAVAVPGGMSPQVVISPGATRLGAAEGYSWTAMAAMLLARLGPFRLAFLEAVVRIADWRASRNIPQEVTR